MFMGPVVESSDGMIYTPTRDDSTLLLMHLTLADAVSGMPGTEMTDIAALPIFLTVFPDTRTSLPQKTSMPSCEIFVSVVVQPPSTLLFRICTCSPRRFQIA